MPVIDGKCWEIAGKLMHDSNTNYHSRGRGDKRWDDKLKRRKPKPEKAEFEFIYFIIINDTNK